MRKHRYIKIVKTEIKRNYLVSELNRDTTKSFTEILLTIEKVKLCYMYTGSLNIYIKTDGTRKNIARDVENRFGTLNYELDRALPKGTSKK